MIRDLFKQIEAELNAAHFERKPMVRGLLLAILSRQHLFMVGVPGADKSGLAEDLTARVTEANFFRTLLGRASTPDEIFGPYSVSAYKQDIQRRKTERRLPEAHIAFIDETFKGSSTILNSMLSIMAERIYDNDGLQEVPLISLIGCSNELPEDREELAALWDRFTLRYPVKWIHDPEQFKTMIAGNHTAGQQRTTVTLAQLEQAQAEVAQVDLSAVIDKLPELRDEVRKQGIGVSDRRFKAAMMAVRAEAWLNGRSVAADSDLSVLVHVLWDQPDQIPMVKKLVMGIASPFDSQADEILDAAVEVYTEAINAEENAKSNLGAQALKALGLSVGKLQKVLKESELAGMRSEAAAEGIDRIQKMNAEVLVKCLRVAPEQALMMSGGSRS